MDEDPANSYSELLSDTVYVVDDDALVRRSVEATLTLVGFKVVQFASAQQFLTNVGPSQSGCVLIDIRMPGMDGLALQEELAKRHPSKSVIIITGHADVPLAVHAVREGALDVLEKPFSNDKLIAVVRSALKIASNRASEVSQRGTFLRKFQCLSSRERDVMDLVVEGYSNREIAAALAISPRTVDVHRARVMEKLEAESLAELVRMAITVR
jgi:two-component system response regulator FixJ